MLNDNRPPLTEDPTKRIAHLEAENAAFRTRIRQLTQFSVCALTSLGCLVVVYSISYILSLYNNGNFSIYSSTTGSFLGLFLGISSLVLNKSFSGIATYLKKIVSPWDILKWVLIPIFVTCLINLVMWWITSTRLH